KAVLDEYPNMNIVGEEMTKNVAQIAYWQKDKKNDDGYVSYLPSLMDFALTDNIVGSLQRNSWRDVYEGIAQDYLFPHPENQLIFPDNHDLDRIYTKLNKNLSDWKMAIAIFMTMRGIPQFFYGTEVLMTNEKLGNDGLRRGDFYGGWIGDTKNAFTGEGLNKDEAEAQVYFAKLLNWRKNSKAITEGKLKHFAPINNDVYVYFRYHQQQKVMIIVNKNANAATLSLNRFAEIIPASFQAKEIISNQTIQFTNNLTIPGKTAYILEIQ
ncbi:MAG: cyclomaltodextrinase C-terminal domain-containing protein, partial [Chitinophagaceae bacterium]